MAERFGVMLDMSRNNVVQITHKTPFGQNAQIFACFFV